MVYDVEDIKREVRIAMDKYPGSEALIETGDIDSISIDEIIGSKIADAARIVEQQAPSHLLDSGRAFGESIGWNGQLKGYGSGYTHLPDDFMRLVTFQMSDWSRPVTEAITEEDPRYAMQTSRFAGVRGNPEKPVVAIVKYPIGLVLEFYSCTAGENVFVKKARYIPIPKVRNGEIELCEKLKSSIVHYCAYMVCMTIGEEQTATRLLKISNELAK